MRTTNNSTNSRFFETMSKRRRGFPSQAQVKRGVRVVHGDKLLEERVGRNDLCPCGSGQLAQERCREYLRTGTSFAFNATNTMRQTRGRWLDLFADYNT